MSRTAALGQALTVAAEHHHLIPTRVLAAEGLTPRQISMLRRDGLLERVTHGLYRLPGTRTPTQDIAAAVSRHLLARASHTSALHLHGFGVRVANRPHITIPPNGTNVTALGTVHRSPIALLDITLVDSIPTTSVARAIVDSAMVLRQTHLETVIDEAIGRHKTTVGAIIDAKDRVEAGPGRLGTGVLRDAMRGWTGAIAPDSPAEATVIRRLVAAGLPTPTTQHEIRTARGDFVARVDLAWPHDRVAREYDSDRWHGARSVEGDERRRQQIEACGWRIGGISRIDLVPSHDNWIAAIRADLVSARRIAG